MSAERIARRIADDVFEYQVETSRGAQALAAQLRALDLAEDVVAGLDTVSLRVDPEKLTALEAALASLKPDEAGFQLESETIELSIQYGGEFGPDLTEICYQIGLSESAFIAMHLERMHTVEMIGFTPGFSYISGLPDGFAVPRLSQPRSRVPAGSVGVSSDYTGVYALAGPGGWPLIGRIQDQLFDPDSASPFRLRPGHRVKFKAV
ncbi:MAG: 5-oxoprolinase subunit PxpB [Pseudomonadota bacterium]